jgi:hypothetical protein
MASKGRNGDTMLVHMTPGEVAGLHALALKHGGELTINPDTGLPEANFLKKLLPTIIGAGISYFSGGMIDPMTAAAMVGGVETVRTGSLERGLMAGFGAYGGAGLAAGFAGAGANALTNAGMANYADTLAAQGLEAGSAAYGEAASKLALEAQKEALAKPFMERATAGLTAATASPEALGSFAKDNFKPLAAAASPILADMMVPTTTEKPKALDSGYIRPYTYNPFGQQYTAQTPIKADEFGNRPMATGGIVALADGGAPPPPSDEDALKVFKGYEGRNLSDAKILNDMGAHGITTEQIARATSTPMQQAQARADAAPYNYMTGGSKAAYDYLMGSGDYPVKPFTPTGEIYKPYSEAVMGMPADPTQFQTIFNPKTRQYEDNPNYKPFTYDKSTGQESRGASTAEINSYIDTLKTGNSLPGQIAGQVAASQAVPQWMTENNVTYEQLAKALGISVAEAKKRYPSAAATTTDGTSSDTYYSHGYDGGGGGGGGEAAGGLQQSYAMGGYAVGGGLGSLGSYSDGGRLLKGPGDGVSDSIPATIGRKQQPARLADGEFVIPARIVSELGNGSTDAGAKKLYAMMDRVQRARGKTTGKNKVAANSRADKYLPA